ncbi:MAG: VCBS repeat-containing protein [Acidobacteriota bacterium]
MKTLGGPGLVAILAFASGLLSRTSDIPLRHVVVSENGPADMHVKAVGDLNGDGYADLIVAGTGGRAVWYEYPTWQEHVITDLGAEAGWSCDAEVGDLDRDGDNDVVISDWYRQKRLVWFENPGAAGGSWTMHVIGGIRAHDIELRDLDRDGDLDIVTRHQGKAGNAIEIWVQQPGGSWTHRTLACPAGEGLHVIDLERDGYPDILIGDRWYRNPRGQPEEDWQEQVFAPEWRHAETFPWAADINRDGRLDIVLSPTEPSGDTHRISWFEAPRDAVGGRWREHVIDGEVETVHHSLAVADMDGDGAPDVVTAAMHQGKDPREVKVYRNLDGRGEKWAKQVLATTGSHCLRVVDLGKDGDFDIFGANWSESRKVELWENLTADSKSRGKRRQVTTAAGPTIEVWHGERQRVGHLGIAQHDFNLLGHVSEPEAIRSLGYSLNGAPEIPLGFLAFTDDLQGGRSPRLVADGDFNADIPLDSLRPGPNRVVLRATDRLGQSARRIVTLERQLGSCPLPVRIDWSKVRNPQEVGQYVDGQWALGDGGLRTLQVGYDRIFLIGEKDWQDYEVTVPVTIHRVTETTGPRSGSNGLGIVLRFTGHVEGGPRWSRFPHAQPKWGYQPFGAIGFLRWLRGAHRPPTKQFYPGDRDGGVNYGEFATREGSAYVIKFGCETLADDAGGEGVTRYSFKVWPAGDREPAAWDWQVTQRSKEALRRGAAALLAHHVDATFGNVSVVKK